MYSHWEKICEWSNRFPKLIQMKSYHKDVLHCLFQVQSTVRRWKKSSSLPPKLCIFIKLYQLSTEDAAAIDRVQVAFLGKEFDTLLWTKKPSRSQQPQRCSLGQAGGSSLAEMNWPRSSLNRWPIVSLVLASNCPWQIYIITWLLNIYLKSLQRKQFTLYKHQLSHLKPIS